VSSIPREYCGFSPTILGGGKRGKRGGVAVHKRGIYHHQNGDPHLPHREEKKETGGRIRDVRGGRKGRKKLEQVVSFINSVGNMSAPVLF